MRDEPGDGTVLSGKLDQAGLHGALMRIRDWGLKLISINRMGSPGSSQDVQSTLD
jgi:hypothetical protein